jgi:predicted oxidoreductase
MAGVFWSPALAGSMNTVTPGASFLRVSRLACGVWRLADAQSPGEVAQESRVAGKRALLAAPAAGYTLFNREDICGNGEAEAIHGELLREHPELRARTVIVTKCGVRKTGEPAGSSSRYDLSGDFTMGCCEETLRRLGDAVRATDFSLTREEW